MKKNILVSIGLIFACCILCCCFGVQQVQAFDGVDFWEEFSTSFPVRDSYSDGEKSAGDYIAGKFGDFGLQGFFDNGFVQTIEYYEGVSTQNIVAIKKGNGTGAKSVVIGAHYDNVKINGSMGANDNASGVAVLLNLASRFAEINFEFDIIFVAFGAEEVGFLGSNYFVNQLTANQLENILLYINLDCIANGDNLYAYAEDIPTDFCNYFLETYATSDSYVKEIKLPPRDLGVTYVSSYLTQKPYSAAYFNTDSISFRTLGVPTISFFAGNLEYSYGYVESNDKTKRVMHTSQDNIDDIKSFGNDYEQNMQSVFNCIYTTLKSPDFYLEIVDARNQLVADIWYQSWLPNIIIVVIFVVFTIVCVSIFKKLQKRAIMNEQPVKNFRIFLQPNDEEVFTFLK